MTNFKSGDKVKVIQNKITGTPGVGQTGTVVWTTKLGGVAVDLGEKDTVNVFDTTELESKVVKIEYWWDKTSFQWIIQAKDAQDNQVGAAWYSPNSRTLPRELEAVQALHPGVPSIRT
jgi:hypothetical protein